MANMGPSEIARHARFIRGLSDEELLAMYQDDKAMLADADSNQVMDEEEDISLAMGLEFLELKRRGLGS